VTASTLGGAILVCLRVLLVYTLATAKRQSGRAFGYTFSMPGACGAAGAAVLNGFALWVGMMIALTVVNYGFPIAQLASLEGTRCGRSRWEFADARPLGPAGASAALAVITVASPRDRVRPAASAHADFTAEGHLGRHLPLPRECRPSGVRAMRASGPRTTAVVLDSAMARAGTADGVGRGATLALQQCTMCHGARGVSEANAPNLAGQYPEVVIKQLKDYQRGDRASAIMQALAAKLSPRDIEDLAVHYASLPRPKNAPVTDMSTVPPLVKVGDPMRNIAPCASCHGGMEQKLGTPWLEGMPKDYLVQQLKDFASGARRNDSHAQMRNMARALTAKEIEEVAVFYARQGGE
jgi:cytochrome c553